MTGLIYNKPDNPIDFLEGALSRVRKNPDLVLRWDSFIDADSSAGASGAVSHLRSAGPAIAASSTRANNNVNRAGSPKGKPLLCRHGCTVRRGGALLHALRFSSVS